MVCNTSNNKIIKCFEVDQHVRNNIIAFRFILYLLYFNMFPGDAFESHRGQRDLQKCDCSLDHTRHSSFHDARALGCLTQCLICNDVCERVYGLKVELELLLMSVIWIVILRDEATQQIKKLNPSSSYCVHLLILKCLL